jgi:hypothetical protein
MEKKRNKLPTGIQTFEKVIKLGGIYVDKTAYLAKMIEDVPTTWFLARPRRFGKSLTVSTFESIFLGQRELFKGLAIEKKLDEEPFAPRPVLHLDMSGITTSQGPKEFYDSLIEAILILTKRLNIDFPPYKSATAIFSSLIQECHRKYGSLVAVLIDEYDAPVTNLLEKPDEAEQVRQTLREFYSQLKANDKHISFAFVTGITKYVKGGLYSAFNNPVDISIDPEYGALAGFTHEEIKRYYGPYVKGVANYQKVSETELLDEMKRYYNGFCFDAETFVYNPFSTLRFFEEKHFDNFWFNAGSPRQLISFLNDNKVKFEDFQEKTIKRDMVVNPVEDGATSKAVFLLQLGYLSLRPSPSRDAYLLDYPNEEVRDSMAFHLLRSYCEEPSLVDDACVNLNKAIINRDPSEFIAQINRIMSEYPYDYYQTSKRDEYFYCLGLFTFFYAAGVTVLAEKHGNFGRADFILKYGECSWVVEITVAHGDDNDAALAASALRQTKEKNYPGGSLNPVLLGVTINDDARAVTAWECQGGIADKPEKRTASVKPSKAARKAKRAKPADDD